MAFYIYVLISKESKRFYIGQTRDLASRLDRHNRGYVKSTAGKGPWEFLFHTMVANRSEAMRIEKKLKNLKSRIRLLNWIGKNLQEEDFVNSDFQTLFEDGL